MTLEDLHDEGYRVIKGASVSGPRGAKSILLIIKYWRKKSQPGVQRLTWSFDGKHYVEPVSL